MAERLGPYTLEKRIGAGGMADVFLARGPMGTCVVKRPHPHLCANAEFLRMFLDEASLLAQLHHPGIAQIFDLGHVGNVYYLAMEYVPGFDLMTISLEHERHGELMAPELCARIVADAAAALHYAHDAKGKNGQPLNLIHRDVSPHNILLSTQGQVKLIDFGVARASVSTHRTQAGFVKGKYPYMSPEQITGQQIDRRVDVYALGLVLYELLTNVRAIAGQTEVEQIDNARASRIRPIEQLRPNTPMPLRQIIGGCLHPLPSGRYPTAQHLKDDLEKYLALERHVVGQEDLLRLFRVVAADVSHLDAQTTAPMPSGSNVWLPNRPTEQDQPALPDTLPPDDDLALGVAPTMPSMKQPAVKPLGVRATAQLDPVKPIPLTAEVRDRRQPWEEPEPSEAGTEPARASIRRTTPSKRPWIIAAVASVAAIAVVSWLAVRTPAQQVAPDAGVATVVDAGSDVLTAFVFPDDAGPADVEPADAGEAAAEVDAGVAPVAAAETASLSVSASFPLTVSVDGKLSGKTPWSGELAPGRHSLVLANEAEFFKDRVDVVLEAGEKRNVSVHPGRGTLKLEAVPFAEMRINGTKVAKTPLSEKTIEVYAGDYFVEFTLADPSLPKPKKQKGTVTVKGGEEKSFKANMLQ